jgi:hypothetical protein
VFARHNCPPLIAVIELGREVQEKTCGYSVKLAIGRYGKVEVKCASPEATDLRVNSFDESRRKVGVGK